MSQNPNNSVGVGKTGGPVFEELQAVAGAAFRVELYARYMVTSNGRAIPDSFVICQGQHISGVFGSCSEGVHEIHPCGIGQAAVDLRLRTVGIELDLIPADGGDSANGAVGAEFRQFSNDSGNESESLMQSEFFAGVEEELHPEADAEQWFSCGDGIVKWLQELELSEGIHGMAEGTDAGQDDAIGLHECIGLC